MLSGLKKEEILFYFVCLGRKRFEGKEKNFSRTTLTLVLLLVEFSIFDQVRIQIVVTGSERQKKEKGASLNGARQLEIPWAKPLLIILVIMNQRETNEKPGI